MELLMARPRPQKMSGSDFIMTATGPETTLRQH